MDKLRRRLQTVQQKEGKPTTRRSRHEVAVKPDSTQRTALLGHQQEQLVARRLERLHQPQVKRRLCINRRCANYLVYNYELESGYCFWHEFVNNNWWDDHELDWDDPAGDHDS